MPARERRGFMTGGRNLWRGISSSGSRFENGDSHTPDPRSPIPAHAGLFFRFPAEPRMSKPEKIESRENRYLRYSHQRRFVRVCLTVSVLMAVMFGALAAWTDHEGHFWFHLFVECTLFFGTI